MTRATVACVKTAAHWDCYVGRGSCPRTGKRFLSAVYANPFPVHKHGFAECIRLYFRHLRANPWFAERARTELTGKVLGCWCPQPGPCHAVILAGLVNGRSLDEIGKEWSDAGLFAETIDLFGGVA